MQGLPLPYPSLSAGPWLTPISSSRAPASITCGMSTRLAAKPADLLHRGERLGKEFAGLRHPLCRGTAALRREPVELRPAVPRPDAQARRRSDCRPEPVDLDLAEIRRPEPALDRRHRSPRFTTTCGCSMPGWARAIARSAAGRSPPRPASRSSSRSPPCRPARRLLVLAPLIRRQKGEYRDLFEDLLKQGFVRARVDGRVVRLSDDLRLDRQMRHDIDVVVDRLVAGPKIRSAAGRGRGVGPAAGQRQPRGVAREEAEAEKGGGRRAEGGRNEDTPASCASAARSAGLSPPPCGRRPPPYLSRPTTPARIAI